MAAIPSASTVGRPNINEPLTRFIDVYGQARLKSQPSALVKKAES